MSSTDSAAVRRITWLDRQRLEAGDLADQHGRQAFTRRLHTSIVHDAWGIALGFGIDLYSRRGQITVAPGLAYDRLGRELVSAGSIAVPSPEPSNDGTSHWFDLVMRWAGLEDLRAGRDPAGSCLTGSAVYEERPLLRWADAGPVQDRNGNAIRPSRYGEGVRLGLDLPLARILVNPDGGTDDLDLSTRRTAHGLARPHIAGGTIRQGVVELDQGSDHRRWSLSVSTDEGGFTSSDTTYLVALGAHPWGDTSGFNSGDAGELVSAREVLADQLPYGQGPFLEVWDRSRTRFRLTVRHGLPERFAFRASIRIDLNPVPVHWVGIDWSGRAAPGSSLINRTAGPAGGPL
ncbi:hypothetical protein EV652_11811 [Kribbella steppae]|uniref:Uncharacterized protein n=1 Tax=Kribbella steppae TaxID=2512223 RepID=A0A4R2H0S1_9ACTN|nr:hypothetical protein [Kribbella steppae]TCO17183.1 hypothetical protein EV652_11811 [Kribbella steppae]